MKEKLFKKGFKKRLFSVILAVTMIIGLMPNMVISVQAANWSSKTLGGITFYYDKDKMIMNTGGADIPSLVCQCWEDSNYKYGKVVSDVSGNWTVLLCDHINTVDINNINMASWSSKTLGGVTYYYVKDKMTMNSGGADIPSLVCQCWEDSNYKYGKVVSDVSGNWTVLLCNHITTIMPERHDWHYSADGATLKAWCEASGCTSGYTTEGTAVTLTLTASDANYSGSPVSKATLFGGMDFTAFNNATGLNLSAANIKIYAATDTSKATALDTINAAGSYVADLTVDTNKTATLDFTVAAAQCGLYVELDTCDVNVEKTTFIKSPITITASGTAYPSGIRCYSGHNITVSITSEYKITKIEATVGTVSEVTDKLTVTSGTLDKRDAGYNEVITISDINSSSITLAGSGSGGDLIFAHFKVYYEALHTCSLGDKIDGQAATCTEDGWKDYYQCTESTCGKIYATNDTSGTAYDDLDAWKTSTAGKIAALGHNWGYTANGATLTASCSRKATCGKADVTLTLTASSPNYSGSPIAKATLFGGMDFTAFNNATGLNLSAADIKIYAATDTSKATALDTIKAAGSYVAVLTVDGNDATLDFTVGRAPNAYTFEYANTVGWGVYPQLAEILKTNGVGGDTITIKNSLESGPAIAVKTSGGPDSDDSWNGSSISCTPGSSTNLTIPANYVVDMIQLNGLEFVCKLKSVHTHNFTYSASGSTLTATCSADGCGLTDKKVSLTLTASDTNYSGIDNLGAFNTATGKTIAESDVKFYKVETANTTTGGTLYEGTLYEGRPTVEGYYYASLTVGEDSNSATAKLAFKTGKIFESDDLTVGTVVKAGDVIKRPKTVNSYLNFGGFYFGLSATRNEGANNILASWMMKSELPPYNGGTLPDWYSNTTIFKVVKVYINNGGSGYHDIYFEPAHDWNYSVNGATLTATCNQGCGATSAHTATLTLSASNANYSGSPATINIGSESERTAWTSAGLTVPTVISYEKADGTPLTAAPTTVGSYVAKVSPDGVDASTTNTAKVSFTIDKAQPTITTPPTAKTNLVYSGEAQALVNAGSGVTGGTLKYSTTENGTYSETIPTGTNAGSYSVWYKVVGDDEHSDTTATEIVVAIAQKEITVTGIKAVEKAYDGTTSVSLDCSNAIFNGKLGADTLTVTATGTMADANVGSNKSVTILDFTLGESSASNYKVDIQNSQTTTTVTVSPVIVNKVEGDFNVTGETPSKEFIVGTTVEASVHIDGLTPEDVKANSVDTDHKGILVMNGETVLVEGTEYTVTSGSVKVNLTKSYLDTLPVGTHNIKVYVKPSGTVDSTTPETTSDFSFDVNVVIKAKPSTGGGSTTPTTTPTYKVPNTSVGNENNSITKTIGLLAIAAVAGYVVKKKEN